eukprot:PhF_6_TR19490/c0_g1_i1/m.28470
MGGLEHIALPMVVLWLIIQIPPTLLELFCYYFRGGLVTYDFHRDDSWNANQLAHADFYVYAKRFCDRPTSTAAKAFYGYLDWSSSAWDKSMYVFRRNLAKHNREVSKWQFYVYGPFIFNWKPAHNKQWFRGDDAAGFYMPVWGNGGEARAREEFAAAKAKGYDLSWHYQQTRRIEKEKAASQAKLAAAAATSA